MYPVPVFKEKVLAPHKADNLTTMLLKAAADAGGVDDIRGDFLECFQAGHAINEYNPWIYYNG